MKLHLLGYGKMGKMVEQVAQKNAYQIVAAEDADVWIDFSHASCVLGHCEKAALMGKPLVIGTTGWEDQIGMAKEIIGEKCGAVYSPNFAQGVHLFKLLVKEAAKLIGEEYEVRGEEEHHETKVDKPSGTAKALAKILNVEFESKRTGTTTGIHSVIFDSEYDTITLTHTAKNRETFAKGALQAAKWIQGKIGFYDLHSTDHSIY